MVEEAPHLTDKKRKGGRGSGREEGGGWRQDSPFQGTFPGICFLPQPGTSYFLPPSNNANKITSPSMDWSISWVTVPMMTSTNPSLKLPLRIKALRTRVFGENFQFNAANPEAAAHLPAHRESAPPSFRMERGTDLFMQPVYTSYHLFIPPHFTKDFRQQAKYK